MNNRIKELRKSLKMKQPEFGDTIGVSAATVSRYESGAIQITETIIKSICREFGVREEWLRTGEGDMYEMDAVKMVDSIAAQFHLKPYARQILLTYVSLPEEEKKALEKFIMQTAQNVMNVKQEASALDVDAAVDEYRRELELQAKAAAESSASVG